MINTAAVMANNCVYLTTFYINYSVAYLSNLQFPQEAQLMISPTSGTTEKEKLTGSVFGEALLKEKYIV